MLHLYVRLTRMCTATTRKSLHSLTSQQTPRRYLPHLPRADLVVRHRPSRPPTRLALLLRRQLQERPPHAPRRCLPHRRNSHDLRHLPSRQRDPDTNRPQHKHATNLVRFRQRSQCGTRLAQTREHVGWARARRVGWKRQSEWSCSRAYASCRFAVHSVGSADHRGSGCVLGRC